MEGILFLIFVAAIQAIFSLRKAKKEAEERRNNMPAPGKQHPQPTQRSNRPIAPPVAADPLREFLQTLGRPQEDSPPVTQPPPRKVAGPPPPPPKTKPQAMDPLRELLQTLGNPQENSPPVTQPPPRKVAAPPPPPKSKPQVEEVSRKSNRVTTLEREATRERRKLIGRTNFENHRTKYNHREKASFRSKSRAESELSRRCRVSKVKLAAATPSKPVEHPILQATGLRAGILWSAILERPRFRTPANRSLTS